MEAIIQTFKDVRERVVPDYNQRLLKADEMLTSVLCREGMEMTFIEVVETRALIADMRTAVAMLDAQLHGTITNLEIAQIMQQPATRGRPKQEDGG